ncbi:MAG: cysteine desulfurase-like protein [Anaerolineaceae bacterium]|nr:cysteine desulfurase-like protein [Anaerolineaceae bacterium]
MPVASDRVGERPQEAVGMMLNHIQAIRSQFPSLHLPRENALPAVFFDNPAGTQVPQQVIDAYTHHFTHANANLGGEFSTSQATVALVRTVRERMAAFLNAPAAEELVFGPNTTTLIRRLSLALAQRCQVGDEIVLTRLDHDANVAPWLAIANETGMSVRYADLKPQDCTLDLASLEAALSDKTRIVATCHAANAPGTINPIRWIAEMARSVGAWFVLDAVQSAPHLSIDVQELGCDFCFVSAYKFYGPHVGIMWGRRALLDDLPTFKVRPAPERTPGRWETGGAAFEALAGMNGLMDYFTWLAETVHAGDEPDRSPADRRESEVFKRALLAIQRYERTLVTQLIAGLRAIPGITLHGIQDPERFHLRVPTVLITHREHPPKELATFLGARGIYTWHGDYYAYEFMRRMGHGERGMLRIGLGHYNTTTEIDRLLNALQEL